ncbi:MAG: CHASE3 domain-containing protein [Actinomycetota bacterium]|nr:CHASE3 domain-containing protein [Actinomycetota bacterium]
MDHTYRVLGEVDHVLEALLNIETGMRGFAAVGAEEFLEPYEAGVVGLDVAFEAGRTLTLDNPAQSARCVRRLIPSPVATSPPRFSTRACPANWGSLLGRWSTLCRRW